MPRGARKGHPKGGGRKLGSLNRTTVEIRGMAQAYGPEALRKAVWIMRSPKTSAQAKMMAINTVLDRAYGKPPISQDINLTGDLHIESLSDRQLAALVARLDGAGSEDADDIRQAFPDFPPGRLN
jgi:hypothetical protein